MTIQADIIKQKLPTNNGGYNAIKNPDGSTFGKTHKDVYDKLTPGDHPIELTFRYQIVNCYVLDRSPLINSGGESKSCVRLG